MAKNLFLIPVPISDNSIGSLSQDALTELPNIFHFIVEDVRTARRMLRLMGYKANFDLEVHFIELDKHQKNNYTQQIHKWFKEQRTVGLLSEAGMPCIADPGSEVVKMAHEHQYIIKPMVGPSSIFLALASSGMNGQNFAFNGYLAIDDNEKLKQLRVLEHKVLHEHQTQLFMETPYRNGKILEFLLKNLQPSISLCIASDILGPDHWIVSKKISDWKQLPLPNIHKKPTIFILGIL
jgi:16S rRNA (cytidine1402-2'-O)-methyltransferase